MAMIRLLAALGVFMFAALWFLGADHGQYINAPRPPEVVADVTPAKRQVFIPAQPVPGAKPELQPEPQVAPDPVVQADVTTAVAGAIELPDSPPAEQNLLATPALAQTAVTVKPMRAPGGATVHTGPGIAFPILGMLQPGGVVMVAPDTLKQGWIRILVDGGGEGWVAAALMRE